jgi:hypothetical protein
MMGALRIRSRGILAPRIAHVFADVTIFNTRGGDGLGQVSRRLAVLCPSFVSDCLETLEEIGIRGRQAWLEAGGEDFLLVPSLNEHPTWVAALIDVLRDHGLDAVW